MEKVKYCPNCMKEYEADALKCECGFEFHVVEVVDEVAATNTVVIDDNVPQFVWSLISFVCPIAGLILAFLWAETYPQRKSVLMKMAIGMAIFWFVFGIVFVLIANGVKTGDVTI